MISNIGKSTRHASCLYSEEKAIKPTYLKLEFSQAPSNLENQLAGSRGDCKTRPPNSAISGLKGFWAE